jgi:hypothetical protein
MTFGTFADEAASLAIPTVRSVERLRRRAEITGAVDRYAGAAKDRGQVVTGRRRESPLSRLRSWPSGGWFRAAARRAHR